MRHAFKGSFLDVRPSHSSDEVEQEKKQKVAGNLPCLAADHGVVGVSDKSHEESCVQKVASR